MFWVRFAIFSLGLLICTAAVSAGEIDRSTDAQGTIHIGNPKTEKSYKSTDTAVDQDTDKDTEKSIEQSDRIDERGRPRSRRPMDPYAKPMLTPGSPYPPTMVRPRPLPGPDPGPPTPGADQGRPGSQDRYRQGGPGLRYTPPPQPGAAVPKTPPARGKPQPPPESPQ
jgi:hypothetical protein